MVVLILCQEQYERRLQRRVQPPNNQYPCAQVSSLFLSLPCLLRRWIAMQLMIGYWYSCQGGMHKGWDERVGIHLPKLGCGGVVGYPRATPKKTGMHAPADIYLSVFVTFVVVVVFNFVGRLSVRATRPSSTLARGY